jgi:hypothetical protein
MNNGQDPEQFGVADRGASITQSGNIPEAVLYCGEMPRDEVANLLGPTPRHARRIEVALIERNVRLRKVRAIRCI